MRNSDRPPAKIGRVRRLLRGNGRRQAKERRRVLFIVQCFIEHERDPAHFRLQLRHRRPVPPRQALLCRVDAGLFKALERIDRAGYVISLVRVHPEPNVRSDRFADQRKRPDVVVRIDPDLDLQDPVAEIFHEVDRRFRHVFRRHNADRGIVFDLAAESADQLPDRNAGRLSHDIVHGKVHGAFCRAVPGKGVIHHEVDPFDLERIHPDHAGCYGPEERVDRVDRLPGDRRERGRFPVPCDPRIRRDLQDHDLRRVDRREGDLERLHPHADLFPSDICDLHAHSFLRNVIFSASSVPNCAVTAITLPPISVRISAGNIISSRMSGSEI